MEEIQSQLPTGWTIHVSPLSGHYYYYNRQTQESTYQRPGPTALSKETPAVAREKKPASIKNIKNTPTDSKKPREKSAAKPNQRDTPALTLPLKHNVPWQLVFLTSGRRFLYNKPENKSLWVAPNTEIQSEIDEIDRDEMLILIAQARGLNLNDYKDVVRGRGGFNTNRDHQEIAEKIKNQDHESLSKDGIIDNVDNGPSMVKKTSGETIIQDIKRRIVIVDESDEEDADQSSDEEQQHIDPADLAMQNDLMALMNSDSENDSQDENAEINDDDNDGYSLSSAERPPVNINQNVDTGMTNSGKKSRFFNMLTRHNVNPYSSWEFELNKVIDEEVYLEFDSTRERGELFNEWAKLKIRELKDAADLDSAQINESSAIETKDDHLDSSNNQVSYSTPHSQYLKFLQANPKPKLFYIEYKRKFRQDPEYGQFKSQIPDKEMEKLYRDLTRALKKCSSEDQRKNLVEELITQTRANLDDMINDARFYLVDESTVLDLLQAYKDKMAKINGDDKFNNDKVSQILRARQAIGEKQRIQQRANVDRSKQILRSSELELQSATYPNGDGLGSVLSHLK